MTQTALSGGGGLIQTMQKSYSMMDLSTAGADPRLASARSQYRDPVIEEAEEEGQLKHYRSEEFLGHTNPAYSSLARTRPDMVKSNEVTRTTTHNNSTFYSLC